AVPWLHTTGNSVDRDPLQPLVHDKPSALLNGLHQHALQLFQYLLAHAGLPLRSTSSASPAIPYPVAHPKNSASLALCHRSADLERRSHPTRLLEDAICRGPGGVNKRGPSWNDPNSWAPGRLMGHSLDAFFGAPAISPGPEQGKRLHTAEGRATHGSSRRYGKKSRPPMPKSHWGEP